MGVVLLTGFDGRRRKRFSFRIILAVNFGWPGVLGRCTAVNDLAVVHKYKAGNRGIFAFFILETHFLIEKQIAIIMIMTI